MPGFAGRLQLLACVGLAGGAVLAGCGGAGSPQVTRTGTGIGNDSASSLHPAPGSDAAHASGPGQAGSGTTTGTARLLAAGSLRGKVVVIDPGHNGDNYLHPAQINRLVAVGNGMKACDTTGTSTDAGYSEAAFTFDVATRLAALLRSAGATVILTRPDNRGVGPCVDERAAIGNRAHADAAISIHGDGAPASGYGFHVIVPLGIGPNDAIVAPSRQLGVQVVRAFHAGTGEPLSTYEGTTTGALVARNDLGGLNLSLVPKIFIECGNMRNAGDARRMTTPAWRQEAAQALAVGIARFLG